MASVFKKLFGKAKTTSILQPNESSASLSKKEKLIAERDKLAAELKRTKIVSTNQREDMLNRIDEITRILRKEYHTK